MKSLDHVNKSRVTKRAVPLLLSMWLFVLVACAGAAPASNSAAEPVNDGAPGSVDSMSEEGEEMGSDEAMDVEMSDELAGEDMGTEEMAEGDTASEEMMDDGEQEMSAEEMVGDEMAAETADEDMAGEMADKTRSARPAWQQIPLTNARTGETFTLGDFGGQRVFVEPMATWCTNCRQQLQHVQAAQEMAPEDAVFIALSVETSLAPADLAQYADAAGFDWIFAVMTPDMLQALVDQFGRSISNPPSTPHFVIATDGTWTDVVTGIDAPEALLAQIESVQ